MERIPERPVFTYIPFEDNLQLFITPYYMHVVKENEETDSELAQLEQTVSQLNYNHQKTKDGYVTVLVDNEKGKILAKTHFIGMDARSFFLDLIRTNKLIKNNQVSTENMCDLKDLDSMQRNARTEKMCFFSKENSVAYTIIPMVIANTVIFRFMRFHTYGIFEGQCQGFYETYRLCICGDKSWCEYRDGSVRPANIGAIYYGINKWKNRNIYAHVYTAWNDKMCEQIAEKLKIYTHMDPSNINNYLEYVDPQKMLTAYKHNTKRTGYFSYVPDAIKRDLEQHCSYKGDYRVFTGEDRKDYVVVSNETDSVVIANQINPTRLYFDENRMYAFILNKYKNEWVSTKNRYGDINCLNQLKQMADAQIPKNNVLKKTEQWLPELRLYDIDAMIRYPIVEKLVKAGFRLSQSMLWEDAIKTNNHNSLNNLPGSLGKFFGVPDGCIKYIQKELSPYYFEIFEETVHSDLYKDALPETVSRIQLANMLCKQYADDMMNNISMFDDHLSKIKYIKYLYRLLRDCQQNNTDISNKKMPNYIIYRDYLERLRDKAVLYNTWVKDNGGIAFEYPPFPKPSALKFLHDKAMRDAQMYEKMQDEEKERFRDEMIHNITHDQKYRQYLFENQKYAVIAPTCSNDLRIEGTQLSHCVASYIDTFAQGQSYIYFVRKKNNIDKPFYTVEIVPATKNNIAVMQQAYTLHNTTVKKDDCKKFFEDWLEEKHIRKNCII